MIVQELSSLGGDLRSPGALVLHELDSCVLYKVKFSLGINMSYFS